MRFPETPRVIFTKHPTEKVICQLRFPPILRVESEPPAEFQERIRQDYPFLNERSDISDLGEDIPNNISKLLKGVELPFKLGAGSRIYDFSTVDKVWSITLSRDFIALTTDGYHQWEEFKARLHSLIKHFQEIYHPAFYSRIGLRYRDLIRREEWGLKDVKWTELLRPHIAGELGTSEIGEVIKAASRTIVVGLEPGVGQVRIQHGLVSSKKTDEMFYVIDADFSIDQKTEVGDAESRLDEFNGEAGNLFRWCIKPRLYDAMGPVVDSP